MSKTTAKSADNPEEIIPIIRFLLDTERERRGYTSYEPLARDFDVSNSTISRWLTGKVCKAAAVLIPIALARTPTDPQPPA